MKVTAETITDEQIRELHAEHAVQPGVASDALSTDANRRYRHELKEDFKRRKDLRDAARERCAAAWNARHGGEP